ncbi:MAG: hypothetical protein ACOCZQ_02310 [Nanoarchaeota archaeon]
MGRFIAGLVIGAMIGYYYGANNSDLELREKFMIKDNPVKYEDARRPCIDEYVTGKEAYIKPDYSVLENITK